MVKIVLEDKGQDLLWLKVNEGGLWRKPDHFKMKYGKMLMSRIGGFT